MGIEDGEIDRLENVYINKKKFFESMALALTSFTQSWLRWVAQFKY